MKFTLKDLTQEQLDGLMKIADDHAKILAEKSAKEGDVVFEEKLKKSTEALTNRIAELEKAVGTGQKKKGIVFGKAKDANGDVEEISMQKFLAMVVNHDPRLKDITNYVKKDVSVQVTTSDSLGGYAIPAEYVAGIIGAINNIASFPAKMRQIRQGAMVAKQTNWAALPGILWATENTRKTSDKFTFGQITRTMKTAYLMVPISNQELDWNNIDMTGEFERMFGELLGLEIEKQGLAGTGSPFTGITSGANVKEVPQADASFSYKDLINILNNPNLLERFRNGAEWYFNRTVLGHILNLVDKNDRTIFDTTTLLTSKLLLGYKFNLSDQMAAAAGKNKIIFGAPINVSYALPMGRDGMRIDVSNSGILTDGAGVVTYNAFEQNGQLVRYESELAINVDQSNAFSVGTDIIVPE